MRCSEENFSFVHFNLRLFGRRREEKYSEQTGSKYSQNLYALKIVASVNLTFYCRSQIFKLCNILE
jgi:hypothetical protein